MTVLHCLLAASVVLASVSVVGAYLSLQRALKLIS
jgi:hypothetical protein